MNVLISGSGIAGLASAISLRRSGHTVTIYERSSLSHEIGAAINVPPNACRVLIPWGLDPQKYKFVKSKGLCFSNPRTLEVMQEVRFNYEEGDAGNERGEKDKECLWYAHRVDLHTALKEMATQSEGVGKPVIIKTSSAVVGYDPNTPSLTLQNGQVVTGDLIIAADGIHSAATRLINPSASHPQVALPANSCYRFLIPWKDIEEDEETKWFTEGDMSGATRLWPDLKGGRRFVAYVCRGYEILNCVVICYNDNLGSEKEDWQATVPITDVLGALEGYNPKLIHLVRTKATDVKRWPLLYRPPIQKWVMGKMALVGDAAHPMLPHQGQGGAQSVEDGLALGLCMSNVTSPSEIPARLELFEKIRKNRAACIQILSNVGSDEETPKELVEFLDGAEIPRSINDTKNFCFNGDVLAKTMQVMKEYDPAFSVPDGFFPGINRKANNADPVTSPTPAVVSAPGPTALAEAKEVKSEKVDAGNEKLVKETEVEGNGGAGIGEGKEGIQLRIRHVVRHLVGVFGGAKTKTRGM